MLVILKCLLFANCLSSTFLIILKSNQIKKNKLLFYFLLNLNKKLGREKRKNYSFFKNICMEINILGLMATALFISATRYVVTLKNLDIS